MRNVSATIVLLGALSACAPPPAPAPAAPPPAPVAVAPPAPLVEHFVNIQGATCDAFLRLSDDDRQAASMFYMGYQARRAGLRSVDVGMIPTITGVATDFCAAEPERRVADVFAEAYRKTRGW